MSARQLLIVLGLVWAITGIIEPHLPNAGEALNAMGVVQGISTTVLLFAWCKAHARAHAIRPATGAALLVGIFAPIGVPYYAFRGFGLRGGARLIALAIAGFAALMAVYFVCFAIGAQFIG